MKNNINAIKPLKVIILLFASLSIVNSIFSMEKVVTASPLVANKKENLDPNVPINSKDFLKKKLSPLIYHVDILTLFTELKRDNCLKFIFDLFDEEADVQAAKNAIAYDEDDSITKEVKNPELLLIEREIYELQQETSYIRNVLCAFVRNTRFGRIEVTSVTEKEYKVANGMVALNNGPLLPVISECVEINGESYQVEDGIVKVPVQSSYHLFNSSPVQIDKLRECLQAIAKYMTAMVESSRLKSYYARMVRILKELVETNSVAQAAVDKPLKEISLQIERNTRTFKSNRANLLDSLDEFFDYLNISGIKEHKLFGERDVEETIRGIKEWLRSDGDLVISRESLNAWKGTMLYEYLLRYLDLKHFNQLLTHLFSGDYPLTLKEEKESYEKMIQILSSICDYSVLLRPVLDMFVGEVMKGLEEHELLNRDLLNQDIKKLILSLVGVVGLSINEPNLVLDGLRSYLSGIFLERYGLSKKIIVKDVSQDADNKKNNNNI